jgi:hypothetical protein
MKASEWKSEYDAPPRGLDESNIPVLIRDLAAAEERAEKAERERATAIDLFQHEQDEREKAEHLAKATGGVLGEQVALRQQAEAALLRMREALTAYCEHKFGCPSRSLDDDIKKKYAVICTCGLDAALADTWEGEKEHLCLTCGKPQHNFTDHAFSYNAQSENAYEGVKSLHREVTATDATRVEAFPASEGGGE